MHTTVIFYKLLTNPIVRIAIISTCSMNKILGFIPILREFSMTFYLASLGYSPIYKHLNKKLREVEEKSMESY